jgi:DNA-binding MarR family transcriptional regulator
MMAVMPDTRPQALLALPTYLAGHAARIGHRVLGDAMAGHDLRLPHFAVLTALAELGPLAQHELADRLVLNRSHLVGYLDEVEARDLVRRERDPEDRRRQRVALTTAGKSLQRKLMREAQRAQDEFLSPLSSDERATLVTLLGRILAAEVSRGQVA